MKKSVPFTAALLVSSAGAFGLGWVLKPAPSPQVNTGPVAPVSGSALTPTKRNKSEASLAAAKANPTIAKYLNEGAISSESMTSAIKAMMKENDPLKKNAMFSALLANLTPENAEAAFTALRESRGRGRGGRGGFGGGGGDGEGGGEMP